MNSKNDTRDVDQVPDHDHDSAVENRSDRSSDLPGGSGKAAQTPSPFETMVVATTDSKVATAPLARPEWTRHPEATISLSTAEFDPADQRRRERRRREAASRTMWGPRPRSPGPGHTQEQRHGPGATSGATTSDRRPTFAAYSVWSSALSHPWVILCACVAGSLVGFAGCRYCQAAYGRRHVRA